jgi:predicted  nucleic acid-binding Zn-ribbon protein
MSDDALIAELVQAHEEIDKLRSKVARLEKDVAAKQAQIVELKYQLKQYDESTWEGFSNDD